MSISEHQMYITFYLNPLSHPYIHLSCCRYHFDTGPTISRRRNHPGPPPAPAPPRLLQPPPRATNRMSDSESSSVDTAGNSGGTSSGEAVAKAPLPASLVPRTGDSDKLEEFQKLLRSMMDSRGGSLDEDEPNPDEMNSILRVPTGRSRTIICIGD